MLSISVSLNELSTLNEVTTRSKYNETEVCASMNIVANNADLFVRISANLRTTNVLKVLVNDEKHVSSALKLSILFS
jgi:hypothetical protein